MIERMNQLQAMIECPLELLFGVIILFQNILGLFFFLSTFLDVVYKQSCLYL